MQYNDIKKPMELLDFMGDIKYGWVRNDDKIFLGGANEESIDDWHYNCIVQDYKGVLKSKTATCWDQVELERNWFEINNYDFETYFLTYSIDKQHSTHTFLVYKDHDKYYWFENAWYDERGIHEYESIDELLNDVIDKSIDYNKKLYNTSEDLKSNVILYTYPAPKGNCSVEGFFNNIRNNGTEITENDFKLTK